MFGLCLVQKKVEKHVGKKNKPAVFHFNSGIKFGAGLLGGLDPWRPSQMADVPE